MNSAATMDDIHSPQIAISPGTEIEPGTPRANAERSIGETSRQAKKSLLVAVQGEDAHRSLRGEGNRGGNSAEGVGLSMYHISPQKARGEEIENRPRPRVTLWRGASLVSAEMGKIQGGKGKKHVWNRGEIKQFSKQSRRRILRIVATIKRDCAPGVFVTATYPDEFTRNPRKVKKHLDNFMKRLMRKFPSAVLIWRMEAQVRKSGKNAGEIAPHFHFLIWGIDYKTLLKWIPINWFEVVGSGDQKHLMAGTRVERIRSTHGVLFYTAKYICKALDYHLDGWGRYWGIVNRGMLHTIQGKQTFINIDEKTATTVLRYLRRRASEIYKKGKFVGRRKFPKWGQKFTLTCNADFWESAIIKMQQ